KMAILMPFASIARCSASTSSLLIECPPLANEPLAFGYDYIPKRGVNVPLGAGAGEGSQGTGQEKLEVAPPERTAKGGGEEGGIRTHGTVTRTTVSSFKTFA